MAVQDVPRSVRIPADIDARLARLASQTGRSKSFYLRALVTGHIDELEWAYGVAAQAEAARSGVAETAPLEELVDEMGFSDAELADAAQQLDAGE